MKKNLTELVFILDRSGSAQRLEGDNIGRFNAMIEKQKKKPGEAFVPTVLFDNQSEVLHDRVKVSEIRSIIEKSTMFRAAPTCWVSSEVLSSTSEISISTPEKRMRYSISFSSSPLTEWRMLAADILLRGEKDDPEKYGWEFLFLGVNIDAVETADTWASSPTGR